MFFTSHLHDGGVGVDERWATVLGYLAAALPADGRLVLVDGAGAAVLADRFAARLRDCGRPAVRLPGATCVGDHDARRLRAAGAVVVADGARWRDQVPAGAWHLTVWVRGDGPGDRVDDANVIVDLRDPAWPVLRHVDPWLLPGDTWYRSESRAFFATRAATWDTKFGADLPAYASAIAEARLPGGGVAVDIGCGTGRAFPALRDTVGPRGTVIGVDHTPQMLAAARDRARDCGAVLLLADARHLPLAGGSVDAVFAAGIIHHLPDSESGLAELARITRPGGRLVLFHPSGRAALAARHGHVLAPDEPLAEPLLRAATARTGWQLTSYDDPPHRFHAVAVRR